MRITRNDTGTVRGPQEWFTGDVHIDSGVFPTEVGQAAVVSV